MIYEIAIVLVAAWAAAASFMYWYWCGEYKMRNSQLVRVRQDALSAKETLEAVQDALDLREVSLKESRTEISDLQMQIASWKRRTEDAEAAYKLAESRRDRLVAELGAHGFLVKEWRIYADQAKRRRRKKAVAKWETEQAEKLKKTKSAAPKKRKQVSANG